MTGPIFTAPGPIKVAYQLGPYALFFHENPVSPPPISYRYMMIVMDTEAETPDILLSVTAEKNELRDEFMEIARKHSSDIEVPAAEEGSYVLGVFYNENHENLGSSTDWGDFIKFKNKAIEIVKDRLSVQGEAVAINPHDTSHTGSEEGRGASIPDDQSSELDNSGWGVKKILIVLVLVAAAILFIMNSDWGQKTFSPQKYWGERVVDIKEEITFLKEDYQECRNTVRVMIKELQLGLVVNPREHKDLIKEMRVICREISEEIVSENEKLEQAENKLQQYTK